jgi:hypothetical protein
VRDVALVPQGDVLHPHEGVPTDEASQTADALGDDRVALVRHRGGPLLSSCEGLLDLADLGACEVADLECEAVERRGEDGERGEQLRVPIALQDLGRARRRVETEALARKPLDLGGRRRIRPDRSGQLSHAHAGEGVLDPVPVALELKRPADELQPEGRRLRVDSMSSTDHDGGAVLARSRVDGSDRALDAVEDELAGHLDREAQRRVEHVGGGQPVVEPSPFLAEPGGDRIDEGGDVVVRRALALGHLFGGRNAGAVPDDTGGVGRNRADLRPRVQNRELDGEPSLELRLLRPGPCHCRPGVTGDHWGKSSGRLRGCTESPAAASAAMSLLNRIPSNPMRSTAR